MNKKILRKLIDVAAGRQPADLLVRNGKIADVYSGHFIEGELAVAEGRIAAMGEAGTYGGNKIADAEGQYVLPGFIDSHIHIESSFLTPSELCRLLVPLGTAAIIADPHEIVNVAGLAGLEYMLAASEGLALDIKFMLPSCVPSTPFEHAGALLDAKSLEEPMTKERILGLGEMMNYPGVINGDDDTLDKLLLAIRQGKLIDGHSPGLGGQKLRAYMAGMIHTDHECSSVKEMTERLSRGMYVMLRQGSACRDLRSLIPAVTPENSRRCLLCSDDYQPRSILGEGHINNDLRICVEEGLSPMTALRMATLNAAECFGLRDRGGFAPGLRADMTLVQDLKEFRPERVFIGGEPAAERGRFLLPPGKRDDSAVRGSFHVKDFSVKKLALRLASGSVWVIDIKPGGVLTGKGRAEIRRDASGNFVFDPAADIAKIAVIERHQNTGNVGLGLIRGYGIRRGAAAISVAHDSHNIICAGTNDADMAAAVERIIALGGGAVLTHNGMVLEEMPLPLGGLMSDRDGVWVDEKLSSLQRKAVEDLGVNRGVEPLMTLCFMSLPVIPEIKITDLGLFDVGAFKFIPLEISECRFSRA
ncbi:MAG: adenine deaminase [Treponema sp.]|jgi:adenine deaminase|nr:adenine deaminase [Treponema sp.]